MPRSVWRGTLSFGLVAIPVSLFPATEPKDVRFHLFDREGRRVRYRRVVDAGLSLGEAGPGDEAGDEAEDEAEDEAGVDADRAAGPGPEDDDPTRVGGDERTGDVEVAYEDLVRGYEVEPETYVFLEPGEIERARPTPSRAIDLEVFVRLEEIDPVSFEKSYLVVPAPGAERPYALLLRALTEAGRVGIGRFVLRTKPHLVALRPREGALALETLFFGDEVREIPASLRDLARTSVSERELEVSVQLVEALAADWDPSMFADEYREELLRMIAERTPERIEQPDEPVEGGESRVGELLDALRRSVEEAKARRSDRQVG
jgi:DNA end-binding protein Ku